MALGNLYFLVFTALVAVNIIFADDSLLSAANEVDLTESASRQVRETEASEDRLFFTLITPCNYTATPGSYCGSCRQAVRCLPNGNGILRNCRGLLPYCYGGRCSFRADPVACNGTTTG